MGMRKQLMAIMVCFVLPMMAMANDAVHVSLSNIHMERLYGYSTFNTVAVVNIEQIAIVEDENNAENRFGIIEITDGSARLPVIISDKLLVQLPNMVNGIENASPVTLIMVLKSIAPEQGYGDSNASLVERYYTLTDWLRSLLVNQLADGAEVAAYIDNINRSYASFDLSGAVAQHTLARDSIAFELVSFQNTGDIGNCADRFSRCEALAGYALPDHKSHLVEWCLNDADRPFEKMKRFQNMIPGWDDIQSTKSARLRKCASVKDSCERLTGDRHLGYSEAEFLQWCLQ